MYRYIEPEVAGGLGRQTILDNSVFPPRVDRLHYEFEDWLGDAVVESFPCFIVTGRLKEDIEKARLTGIYFDDVLVTQSANFPPTKHLPEFYWAKITGTMAEDDFTLSGDFRLAVSAKAFTVLKNAGLTHAIVNDMG